MRSLNQSGRLRHGSLFQPISGSEKKAGEGKIPKVVRGLGGGQSQGDCSIRLTDIECRFFFRGGRKREP